MLMLSWTCNRSSSSTRPWLINKKHKWLLSLCLQFSQSLLTIALATLKDWASNTIPLEWTNFKIQLHQPDKSFSILLICSKLRVSHLVHRCWTTWELRICIFHLSSHKSENFSAWLKMKNLHSTSLSKVKLFWTSSAPKKNGLSIVNS